MSGQDRYLSIKRRVERRVDGLLGNGFPPITLYFSSRPRERLLRRAVEIERRIKYQTLAELADAHVRENLVWYSPVLPNAFVVDRNKVATALQVGGGQFSAAIAHQLVRRRVWSARKHMPGLQSCLEPVPLALEDGFCRYIARQALDPQGYVLERSDEAFYPGDDVTTKAAYFFFREVGKELGLEDALDLVAHPFTERANGSRYRVQSQEINCPEQYMLRMRGI